MKDCFGTIYPDMTEFQFGKDVAGKIFLVRIDTIGPGHRDRQMRIDLPQWQRCQQCEEFRSCYDFSNSKLAMQQVVRAV